MTPRYFWRRLGAIVIDYLAASILAMLVLLPFVDEDRAVIRFVPLLNMQSCGVVQTLPKPLHDAVAPYKIQSAKICRTYAYGVFNGLRADLTLHEVVSRNGSVTTTTRVTTKLAIDRLGNPVTPLPIHSIGSMALVILLAGFAGAFWPGRSIGKKMLGLQVSASTHPITTGSAMLARECLKWAPLLVFFGLNFVLTITAGPKANITNPVALTFYGICALALLIFYVLPVLRWRGATFYDRYLGLRVDRGENAALDSARTFE